MKKRFLSLFLIGILVISTFVGCKKVETPKQPVSNNEMNNEEQNKDNEIVDEGPKFELVANGVSDYVIVRSEDYNRTEIYAAEELQKYIKQISGAELPIITDNIAASEKEIIIGKTNREKQGDFDRTELTEDGFVIKTEGGKIWLVGGGNRGTLYSVYSFLEEYLGCRFYTEYVEKVPEMQTILVKEVQEDKQIPVYQHRDVAVTEYLTESISVKRKINAAVWGRKLSDKVGGGNSYATGHGGHSFFNFVSPDVYFKEHPEYFSMDENGERVADRQLCLTNPDVLKVLIEGVKGWLESDPDANIVTVTQNDWQGGCLCDKCKAVYEEEGGAFSGAYIRFVNAVAAEIKKEYPDVWIDTYAYQFTRSAPTKTKPADNVIVRLCTIECCFSHPHSEECDARFSPSYLDGSSNTFAEDLTAWSKICDNLWIYDYHMNTVFKCMIFPDFDNLRENYAWYADNGVVGAMPEALWSTPSVAFPELRAYLISKLLWNPYMSEEEFNAHMDDFLEGVYGVGGTYLKQYIELAEELTEDLHFDIGAEFGIFEMYPLTEVQNHSEDELPKDLTVDMIKNYEKTDWSKYWNWYTDMKENPITLKGETLFVKAMQLAETEEERLNIERAHLQIKTMKSYCYSEQLYVAEGTIRKIVEKFIEMNSDKFTDEEKAQLPVAVDNFAYEQCYGKYAEYNKALCQELVDWGIITGDGIASYISYLKFDYAQIPSWWG